MPHMTQFTNGQIMLTEVSKDYSSLTDTATCGAWSQLFCPALLYNIMQPDQNSAKKTKSTNILVKIS